MKLSVDNMKLSAFDVMHFQQCHFEDGFYMNRKAGTGGFIIRLKKAWLCLGSAIEWHWLALGDLSLSFA